MPTGLSDILDKIRGIDTDEEARRKQRASSPGAPPTEQGLEEESGPIDIIRPYKQAAIQNSGLASASPLAAKLADLAIPDSPLSLMRGGGTASAANRTAAAEENQLSRNAYKKAIERPNGLGNAMSDVAGANAASDFEDKATRKGAQDLSDLRNGIKKPGGPQTSPPDTLDYSKINKITPQSEEATKSLDYGSMGPSSKSAQPGNTLSYNKPDPSVVRDLQSQLDDLNAAKDYQGARNLQQKIQKYREGDVSVLDTED